MEIFRAIFLLTSLIAVVGSSSSVGLGSSCLHPVTGLPDVNITELLKSVSADWDLTRLTERINEGISWTGADLANWTDDIMKKGIHRLAGSETALQMVIKNLLIATRFDMDLIFEIIEDSDRWPVPMFTSKYTVVPNASNISTTSGGLPYRSVTSTPCRRLSPAFLVDATKMFVNADFIRGNLRYLSKLSTNETFQRLKTIVNGLARGNASVNVDVVVKVRSDSSNTFNLPTIKLYFLDPPKSDPVLSRPVNETSQDASEVPVGFWANFTARAPKIIIAHASQLAPVNSSSIVEKASSNSSWRLIPIGLSIMLLGFGFCCTVAFRFRSRFSTFFTRTRNQNDDQETAPLV